MVITDHTTKAFDIDLQELTRMVAEMGGLAEKQVADAVDALARRDADRAQQTVATDPDVDALQAEIEEKAVLTIARRQPMGSTCGRSSVRCASPMTSSVSAILPRISASG